LLMPSQADKLALLQQNYEAVVAMLREAEEANATLKEEHQAEAARWAKTADEFDARESERDSRVAAEREARASQVAEFRKQCANLEAERDEERRRRTAAEERVIQLEQEASAASSRYEAGVAEAEQFAEAGKRRAEAELDSARRRFAADAERAAEEAAKRVAECDARVAEAKAEAETLRSERDAASARADERAAAAGATAEKYKTEARRSVGVERQRVAGMLYKEALQTQTLEDQERQLEELNEELADARESLRESQQTAREYAARLEKQAEAEASAKMQLGALGAAQSKSVEYIEELDERLALEQAAREEQQTLITQLQEALTARTAKESNGAARLAMTEGALNELKQEARSLRAAVRASQMNKTHAATQTDANTSARLPQTACQTEWTAVQMPLPCLPHGGTWAAGGKPPEVVRPPR
jgi:chromosome segregation ATPase